MLALRSISKSIQAKTATMILYPNSPIRMDYDPATDILCVEYPDLETLMLPAIKHSLMMLVEAIRNYDVGKLLLDASKTNIHVSEEESREVTMQLAADLLKTRLQKVARIQPVDPIRESNAQSNIRHMAQNNLLPYQLQTFTSKAAAMDWLQEKALAHS